MTKVIVFALRSTSPFASTLEPTTLRPLVAASFTPPPEVMLDPVLVMSVVVVALREVRKRSIVVSLLAVSSFSRKERVRLSSPLSVATKPPFNTALASGAR